MDLLKELRSELLHAVKQIETQIKNLPDDSSFEYDPAKDLIMRTKWRTLTNVIFIIECKQLKATTNILIHRGNHEHDSSN